MIDIPIDNPVTFSDVEVSGTGKALTFSWTTSRAMTTKARYRREGERHWQYSHEIAAGYRRRHVLLSADEFRAGKWRLQLGGVQELDRSLIWSQTFFFTMAKRSDRMSPAERWERIDQARRWEV